MNRTLAYRAGFSLVEMIITIVISGVLFITVAMIIMYANESLIKANNIRDLLSDSRSGKKTIEYQIRSAITVPAEFYYSTSEPFTMSPNELFLIKNGASGGQEIVFNVIDRIKKLYKLDRFRYDNTDKTIVYDYWEADSSGANPTYSTHSPTMTVIINDAIGMYVTPVDSNPVTNVRIDIMQSKQLKQGSSEVMTSTMSFKIKSRNLK